MLTEEQVKDIKGQLLKQVENFPPEQKDTAKQQIEAMDAAQLETFLEKNKLIKDSGCIFCSIAKGDTASYKINENQEAIAVLDINPVSKGQALVLPKEHKPTEETNSLQLAQETAKNLKAKLGAEDVKIETANVQGHGIINIIPLYKDKKLERKKANDKELYELQQKLKEEPKPVEEKKPKKKIKVTDLPKAPVRMP